MVDRCTGLLGGADPLADLELLPWLGGTTEMVAVGGTWPDYWARVWGARALLHVWRDRATPVVVRGLGDPSWRVAEMCLKVSAARGVGEAGPGAAALRAHELPRVRAAALRALGLVGDTEHVASARSGLDDPEDVVRGAAELALRRMAERLDLPPG